MQGPVPDCMSEGSGLRLRLFNIFRLLDNSMPRITAIASPVICPWQRGHLRLKRTWRRSGVC